VWLACRLYHVTATFSPGPATQKMGMQKKLIVEDNEGRGPFKLIYRVIAAGKYSDVGICTG